MNFILEVHIVLTCTHGSVLFLSAAAPASVATPASVAEEFVAVSVDLLAALVTLTFTVDADTFRTRLASAFALAASTVRLFGSAWHLLSLGSAWQMLALFI